MTFWCIIIHYPGLWDYYLHPTRPVEPDEEGDQVSLLMLTPVLVMNVKQWREFTSELL